MRPSVTAERECVKNRPQMCSVIKVQTPNIKQVYSSRSEKPTNGMLFYSTKPGASKLKH